VSVVKEGTRLYQGNSLPPSMKPPPEEGYDPEDVNMANWIE
jgi:hypothetical protein